MPSPNTQNPAEPTSAPEKPVPSIPAPARTPAPARKPLTIGEVSKMFDLPVSTIRYYDKQGLFSSMPRTGGQRRFGQPEIETLRVIECLKSSGLNIADIRQFMEAVARGPETYQDRLELFEARRDEVEQEIARLGEVLKVLSYKCWYYEALVDGAREEELGAAGEAAVPPEHREGWRHIHAHWDED